MSRDDRCINFYRGDKYQNRARRNEHRDWCAIRDTPEGPGKERNTDSRMRRNRRRSKPFLGFGEVMLHSEKHSHEGKAQGQVSTRTSLCLKHIMRKCKTVNYVDTETSSGTQISSRESSKTTLARLHRACTVGEAQHKHRGAHGAQLCRSLHETLRTQSLARKREPRVLDGTNGDDLRASEHHFQPSRGVSILSSNV